MWHQMTSLTKANQYFKQNKVFPLLNKGGYEIYGVEGGTGLWEVRYDLNKKQYECNCKNIRLTPCAHILAVKMYKGE